MTTYTFNFAAAEGTLDHMASINQRIREALDSLERTCQTTMADWTDDSKNAYIVQKQRWDQNAAAMNQALLGARRVLGEISMGYGDAQSRATNLWQNTYTG
jgi:WXG100 family type VII secretion target